MPAARLLPGPTQSAAEPTTGTTAAAASADTDENGRVCVAGLRSLSAAMGCRSRRHRSTSGLLLHDNCARPWYTPRQSALAAKACCTCHALLASVLVRCYSRRHRSTSGLLLHANCAAAALVQMQAARGAPRAPRAARAARSSRRAWAADMPHSTHGLGTRHASRLWQRRPAVPAMRCCCS